MWSYGKQAEPILEQYLKLRYELMPYIYSLGWFTHKTGAPFMRALFMDFPNDPKVAEIGDEYMFGPAFLVAPVTDQGQTTKAVYLPAGADWYNYWTHERMHGGQTVMVDAPIDKLPLFVRAGSIIPLGSAVDSTADKQTIAKVQVWPGANAEFDLYQDDGRTYAYEKGDFQLTHLEWDESAHVLRHTGTAAWSEPDAQVVEVIAGSAERSPESFGFGDHRVFGDGEQEGVAEFEAGVAGRIGRQRADEEGFAANDDGGAVLAVAVEQVVAVTAEIEGGIAEGLRRQCGLRRGCGAGKWRARAGRSDRGR